MSFTLFVTIIFSYLLGAIPFGWVAGKILKGMDIRDHGTGNLGASNAGQVLGTRWGLLVYLLDILKGTVAGVLGQSIAGPLGLAVCGLAAVIGHDFPIFLGFHGGKGIATTTGVIWAMGWQIAIIVYAAWIVGILITRHFILSSLLDFAVVVAVGLYWQFPSWYVAFGALAGLIALQRHWGDLQRILRGEEPPAFTRLFQHFAKSRS